MHGEEEEGREKEEEPEEGQEEDGDDSVVDRLATDRVAVRRPTSALKRFSRAAFTRDINVKTALSNASC
jgi:hypothetical protein